MSGASWMLLALPACSYLAYVDSRQGVLPNGGVLAVAVLGVLLGPLGPMRAVGHALATTALLFAAALAVEALSRGRAWLGMGDVKLAGAAAAWLGVLGALVALEAALCLVALHRYGVAVARRVLTGRWEPPPRHVPLGPALCFAMHLVAIAGGGVLP